MTFGEKLAEYKKATGALIGTLVGLGAAVLSANVLPADISHQVAIACVVGTALLGPLGAAIAPKNGPKQTVLVDQVTKTLNDAAALHGAVIAAAAELERQTHPMAVVTQGPVPIPAPSTVQGGVFTAPPLEPPGSEG